MDVVYACADALNAHASVGLFERFRDVLLRVRNRYCLDASRAYPLHSLPYLRKAYIAIKRRRNLDVHIRKQEQVRLLHRLQTRADSSSQWTPLKLHFLCSRRCSSSSSP